MSLYRRLWVALGLMMLFLAATAIEAMVVMPVEVRHELARAVTLAPPPAVTSSRS